MKKVFIWIFSFLLLIGASFAGGRYWKEHRRIDAAVNAAVLDFGFSPAAFPLHNRSFVIFISGFNNGAFVEKTLRSVFSQVYDNYRVIYIDDASTDGSFEVARDLISQSPQAARAAFVHNEQRIGFLANLIRAASVCQDQEILVILNGEDWLAHEWVLSRLNQYYADPDLWLTYGQYREFPTFRIGSVRNYLESEGAQLRAAPFAASHLKTFYAGLFKHIPESDLLYQGAFLPQATDLAIMLPMIEMAFSHFHFIPEILYIANRRAPPSEDHELQMRCERYIRSLKPYSPLPALQAQKSEESSTQEDS